MFEKKDKKATTQNIIEAGTTINGDIFFSDSLIINGVVKGNIAAIETGDITRLYIGPNGSIVGNISATHAVIQGAVEGAIDVQELVEMHKSAQVRGDCTYKELLMEAGAYFEGSFHPTYNSDLYAEKPAIEHKQKEG